MHDVVKDYYGHQLQGTADLCTTACCDASQTPEWLKALLARIHPEVTARYYGCGLVCPPLLGSCRVLDLGCGAGRDLYALAQLVGEGGQVVGVDMTEAQLAVAERHRAYHRQAFGFAHDNVRPPDLAESSAIPISFFLTPSGGFGYANTRGCARDRPNLRSGQSPVGARILLIPRHGVRMSERGSAPGLHRAPGRVGPGGRLLRLRGLQLRGQPLAGQRCGAARSAPAAQVRRRVVFL